MCNTTSYVYVWIYQHQSSVLYSVQLCKHTFNIIQQQKTSFFFFLRLSGRSTVDPRAPGLAFLRCFRWIPSHSSFLDFRCSGDRVTSFSFWLLFCCAWKKAAEFETQQLPAVGFVFFCFLFGFVEGTMRASHCYFFVCLVERTLF